jgi:hypothetical protein
VGTAGRISTLFQHPPGIQARQEIQSLKSEVGTLKTRLRGDAETIRRLEGSNTALQSKVGGPAASAATAAAAAVRV